MQTLTRTVFKSKPAIPNQRDLTRKQRDKYQKKDKRLPAYFFTYYPCIIGIELEVENLDIPYGDLSNLWKVVEEGSLKDNGREVLSIPLQGRNIDYALDELDALLKRNPFHYFNHRCSTHIHINVSALPIETLLRFISLYIALEPYFYEFVEDPLRKNGSYCVPLTEVALNKKDLLNDPNTRHHSKYLGVAFNHLDDFGTVEFRHMVGTNDMVRLRRWIMMIQKTMWYAINNQIDTDDPLLANKVFNTLFNLLPGPTATDLTNSKEAAIFFSS